MLRIEYPGNLVRETVMRHATEAQKLLGLRIHAIAFIAGIVIAVIVNMLVGPPYWAHWVLLGWGVGQLSHWLCIRYFDGRPAGSP